MPAAHDIPMIDRLKAQTIPGANGCILFTGKPMKNGYAMICGNNSSFLVHRVAYEAAKGPIPKGMDVCHSCDVRNCVNPEHLFLGTRAVNVQDMMEKDRMPRGEKRAWAKLTEDKVREIRALAAQGYSKTVIGERYGIAPSTAWKIINCIKWKHVV